MSKHCVAALAALLALSLMEAPALAQTPWYALSFRGEFSNEPRYGFNPLEALNPGNFLGLTQLQMGGRLPFAELRVGDTLAPNITTEVSGTLRQDIEQPLTNPELYQAYRSRIAWLQAGGRGLNPLYVPQIEDAMVTWADPGRQGLIRVGQFTVPSGFDDYQAVLPPVALAPIETPMTDYLSSLGPGVYQNSTMVRWRDIGAQLSGNAGPFPYYFGVFNGSGPNRLDDNGEKDWFTRLDWRSSQTDLIGASILWGQDQVYPVGYTDPGVSVGRRRYDVHLKFNMGDVSLKGEWAREQRIGLDPVPRDGWVSEISQTLGSGDHFYVGYSQYFDPNALPGRSYMMREATIGDVRPLLPGVNLRFELDYHWESSGDQRDEYGRYLTTLEAALGGPPPPEPQRPGGMPLPSQTITP